LPSLPINLVDPSTVLNTLAISDADLKTAIRKLADWPAAACAYDNAAPQCADEGEVLHALHNVVALGFQLVKPTKYFCEFWMRIEDTSIKSSSSAIHRLKATDITDPYLQYQQHNQLLTSDVNIATGFLQRLEYAMQRNPVGSWAHPCGSVHRALILFAQGYGVNLSDLRQLLWAAGLDCLFASKRDSKKRGAQVLAARLRTFFGAEFRPYKASTVTIPVHQKSRLDHRLADIGTDIFKLRNSYIHGLMVPEAFPSEWLTQAGQPPESGRAYQLLECTEILLRQALLEILRDQNLFDTFRDPKKLDNYLG
jgi:hypothetical protein